MVWARLSGLFGCGPAELAYQGDEAALEESFGDDFATLAAYALEVLHIGRAYWQDHAAAFGELGHQGLGDGGRGGGDEDGIVGGGGGPAQGAVAYVDVHVAIAQACEALARLVG